jgi:predicted MFS family arabinose efflux permease
MPPLSGAGTGWRRLALALPVALAFADASIVLIALPEIVTRLHTSISHVVWVIVIYNLALIAGSLAVRFAPSRFPVEPLLVTGLLLFGAASLVAGLVSTLTGLLVARGFQGLGGAVLLCASLPPLARAASVGDPSPLRTWSTAAAIGAAVGPAAGGVLTQLFDWRAIFIAQAPVAALAAVVVWQIARTGPDHSKFADPVPADARTQGTTLAGSRTGAIRANLALMLLSAGLIGALFLSTLLLINVWGLSPIDAAAVLLVLPLLTAVTGRFTRGLDPRTAAAAGSVAVAAGVAILALSTNRAVVVCVVALALAGAGLGVAFAALTEEALSTGPTMLARVANTIAARDLGLVIGLLALTPIFVHDLGHVQSKVQSPLKAAVSASGLSTPAELALAVGLQSAADSAPPSQLPDIRPTFRLIERIDFFEAGTLRSLQPQVESIIRAVATKAFRSSLLGAVGFALLALIVVAVPLPRRSRAAPV